MPANSFDKTADINFGFDLFLSNRQPYNVNDIGTDIVIEAVTVFRGETEIQVNGTTEITQNADDPVGRYNVLLANSDILDASTNLLFILEDGDDIRFRIRATTTAAEGDIVIVRDFDIDDTTVPRGYFELPQTIMFAPSTDGGVAAGDGFIFNVFGPDGEALAGAAPTFAAITHSRGNVNIVADPSGYQIDEDVGVAGQYTVTPVTGLVDSVDGSPIELQGGDEIRIVLNATIDDVVVTGTTTVQVESGGAGIGRIEVGQLGSSLPNMDGNFNTFTAFTFNSAGELDTTATITLDRAMVFYADGTAPYSAAVLGAVASIVGNTDGSHSVETADGAAVPVRGGDYLQLLLKATIEGKVVYNLVDINFRHSTTPRIDVPDNLQFVPSEGGANIRFSTNVITGTPDSTDDAEASNGIINDVRLYKQDGTEIAGAVTGFEYTSAGNTRWEIEYISGFESAPGVPLALEPGDRVVFDLQHTSDVFYPISETVTASIVAAGRPFAM